MRIEPVCVPDWAGLAWVARFVAGQDALAVYHGPRVEVGTDWLAEAVWCGEFGPGEFDRTDLVYGSGLRVRPDGVHVVSSATGVDRLWFSEHEGTWHASNSLPAMLATSGASLVDDYDGYSDDLASVEFRGLRHCAREIPARPRPVQIVYFDNLFWDGRTLQRRPKPHVERRFEGFGDYEGFLADTARQLGANLSDPHRAHPITPLTTISRGYDSAAASAIARLAGCRQAVTIPNARSLLPRSDDGSEIAAALGLACTAVRHRSAAYRREVLMWAVAPHGGGMNLTLFDYPKPLCLLFTATYGDKVWDIEYHDLSDPVGDSDMQIGEFRLWEGVFHTVVPWWGIRSAQQVNAIGGSEQMKPWSIGGAYDRPIPRRILEEAGVPRKLFGRRKLLTASNRAFHWPFSREARGSFGRFLAARGLYCPPDWLVGLVRWAALAEDLVYLNLLRPVGLRRRLRPWRRLAGDALRFRWANEELTRTYRAGLDEVGG